MYSVTWWPIAKYGQRAQSEWLICARQLAQAAYLPNANIRQGGCG
jgi:hypothetical protein